VDLAIGESRTEANPVLDTPKEKPTKLRPVSVRLDVLYRGTF
jgi:hypothetical protein